MDLTTMEWVQAVTLGISVIGPFLWVRAEAKNDARHFREESIANRLHFEAQCKENARHAEILIDAIRQDVKEFHNEMKDFHGVLCGMQATTNKKEKT